MKKKINKERILSDCRPDWCFWTCSGSVLHNIYELASFIESTSQETFAYHANREKNDFARWIDEVLGDPALASQIENETDRQRMLKKVRKRLKVLEKYA